MYMKLILKQDGSTISNANEHYSEVIHDTSDIDYGVGALPFALTQLF